MLTMSKRSISITTSSANRSHNHLPPPAVVSGAQRIPGILTVSGVDLRPQQQPVRKSHKQSASYGSRKKPPKAQDALSSSSSMPASLNSQTVKSKSDLPLLMGSPSGRLARARAQSRTLSGSLSAALSEETSDPFLDSAVSFSGYQPQPKPVSSTPVTPSPRRRTPKSKAKSKADKTQRSKEIRKEHKHNRREIAERVLAERVDDEMPSDASAMAIDIEEPSLQSDASFFAPAPSSPVTTTPPPSSNSFFGFSSSLGVSAPISVPSSSHDGPSRSHSRPRIANSTPSTPPRSTSIQASSSFRIPGHSRTLSHPMPFMHFSTSAPSSPSGPSLLYGARYANSTFQHSPSPNALPKPKFLDTVFMELDEDF